MTFQAAMEVGSGKLWNAVLQAAEHIVEGKKRPAAKLDDHRLLD